MIILYTRKQTKIITVFSINKLISIVIRKFGCHVTVYKLKQTEIFLFYPHCGRHFTFAFHDHFGDPAEGI